LEEGGLPFGWDMRFNSNYIPMAFSDGKDKRVEFQFPASRGIIKIQDLLEYDRNK
jgi:hypothetical protein